MVTCRFVAFPVTDVLHVEQNADKLLVIIVNGRVFWAYPEAHLRIVHFAFGDDGFSCLNRPLKVILEGFKDVFVSASSVVQQAVTDKQVPSIQKLAAIASPFVKEDDAIIWCYQENRWLGAIKNCLQNLPWGLKFFTNIFLGIVLLEVMGHGNVG